jgi:hypothetical protein
MEQTQPRAVLERATPLDAGGSLKQGALEFDGLGLKAVPNCCDQQGAFEAVNIGLRGSANLLRPATKCRRSGFTGVDLRRAARDPEGLKSPCVVPL